MGTAVFLSCSLKARSSAVSSGLTVAQPHKTEAEISRVRTLRPAFGKRGLELALRPHVNSPRKRKASMKQANAAQVPRTNNGTGITVLIGPNTSTVWASKGPDPVVY